jgi:hypothetical protein
MGFFGLYGSTAALATTFTLASVINCIGTGFERAQSVGVIESNAALPPVAMDA